MTDHVYKTIQITGTSTVSLEDAIRGAIDRTAKSVHNLRWFKVLEVRGDITGAAVKHWQATINIGFTMD
jgi:flavin-binding protein dodecin